MNRVSQRLGLLALLIAAGPLPARTSARGVRAVRLLRAGRTAEAVVLLRAALEAEPKSAVLATDLAFAEQLSGRFDEAERLFRHAIELDPRRWYAYANLASMKSQTALGAAERDSLMALLERGMALQKGAKEGSGRAGLLLAMADVERAAGDLGAARGRMSEAQRLPLTAGQQRRAAALGQALEAAAAKSGEARAAEEWPEPPIDAATAALLAAAEALLARDPAAALLEAAQLSAQHRTWRGPRWLAARALIALDQFEAGTRELEALLRLAPAHAGALRLLGETLAAHGGPFEAERADRALRRALALEPGWSELWGVRGRLLFRSGNVEEARRALEREAAELKLTDQPLPGELSSLLAAARAQAQAAPTTHAAEAQQPSAGARELLREAREQLAAGDRAAASERLSRALADSPALVEAAALRWSLDGASPEPTARALWSDGAGLLRLVEAVRGEALAQALRAAENPGEPEVGDGGEPADGGAAASRAHLEPAAVAELVRPWLERAAALGEGAALLERARLRAASADPNGALDDLGAAVAGGLGPDALEQAQGLRAALDAGPGAALESERGQIARALLAAPRAEDLLAALGGDCAPAGDAARAITIGAAHELLGELAPAIACYRAALAAAPADPLALTRLARAAARAPLALLAPLAPALERAADAGIPSALFAQARLLAAAGRTDEALAALERARAIEGPPGFVEPGSAAARALRERLERERTQAGAAKETRLAAALALLGALAAAIFVLFFRGLTVSRALRRDAALFPAVARAVAEIRHDALKHRASALAMLGSAPREEVQRALGGERPAAELIADAYRALAQAAEARGLRLRPLQREPAFGPLFLDLRRAGQQLARPAGPGDERIAQVASRMHVHADRLAALLKQGPRTRLDAGQLAVWIGAAESELRARGLPWSSPALELQGLELDFPVAREPLAAIFANLIRNAQAAAARAPAPRVLVRVSEQRDLAGRRILELRIGDSSPEPLLLEQIESRESGRGLALVRDLVREWQGHLRVHEEPAPWKKSIAACFPGVGP